MRINVPIMVPTNLSPEQADHVPTLIMIFMQISQ
jgi:hypothetical protein